MRETVLCLLIYVLPRPLCGTSRSRAFSEFRRAVVKPLSIRMNEKVAPPHWPMRCSGLGREPPPSAAVMMVLQVEWFGIAGRVPPPTQSLEE